MLEFIGQIDEKLFFLINQSHFDILDIVSPYFRHKLFWAPFYVFIIAFLIYNFPKKGLIMVLFALLSVGISDALSSHLIKKSVQRSRPCNDPEIREKVTLRIRCGGGYSFTSSHAANHASLASFLYFLLLPFFRRRLLLLPVWALSIGLAQVYVGVHYPSDIFFGFILGAIVGWINYRFFVYFHQGYFSD